MIGILDWEIRHGNTVLPAVGGSLTIDDQNIPAIVAQAVVPYDEALYDAIDPRQTPVPRVMVTGRFTQWASSTVADLSAYLVANSVDTVAELSTLWAGLAVEDVTDLFGAPLDVGAGGNLTPQEMDVDLHVREISHDYFTMTVSLASDEALLTDWAPTSAQDMIRVQENEPWTNPQQVQYWVDPVLITVLGQRLDASPYNTQALSTTYSDIVDWSVWSSAWDLMRPAIEDADLKLRVNPDGRGFSLQRPENAIKSLRPGYGDFSHLFTYQDVIAARPIRSRTGDWYDSALLQTDGADGPGNGYPTNGGAHSRTIIETVPKTVKPTAAMALNITRRTRNRGELIEITAPIRLNVFMTDEFTYAPFDGATGPPFQWRVKSIAYDFLAGTMTLRGERRY